MAAPLFSLGRLVATAGALTLLTNKCDDSVQLLVCYQAGDWGEVQPEDMRKNEL